MTAAPPRIAFFADSFHEVNGVALTSRQLYAFARRRGLPFLSVRAGERTRDWTEGSTVVYEIARGRLRIPVEADLYVDPLVPLRHRGRIRRALSEFRPDIVHFTGLNDISLLGALAARDLGLPMTASWHTNVHEYADWRLRKALRWAPRGPVGALARWASGLALAVNCKLYGAARVCFAPNPELVDLLRERTGRPCELMRRGVEIDRFSPQFRHRSDDVFEIGYVGRISAEKNVRFLKTLEERLEAAGAPPFRIVVIGHGAEQAWLEANLRRGVFPGVLKGETLARAYANFDLFVFPSFTDAYGNVINEAMASGVPCVVTSGGGPKYLIEDGRTGVVARDDAHFVEAVLGLMRDPERHAAMRLAAREHAVANSWDRVFERLYEQYARVREEHPARRGLG